MRFIGDVHSQFDIYLKLIENSEESVQVGDFGIGFNKNPVDAYDTAKHRFIRGNHDFPAGCLQEPNYIADGHVERDMMFVGGALSIDRAFRTEGIDWWRDEELSMNDLYIMYDKYVMNKPRVMVAHEFPETITNYFPLMKFRDNSRTRECFEAMFAHHKPELWIGGHWHLNFDQKIDHCRFIVLDCNSYIDIDLNTLQSVGHQKVIDWSMTDKGWVVK